jgi:hypothetical protein
MILEDLMQRFHARWALLVATMVALIAIPLLAQEPKAAKDDSKPAEKSATSAKNDAKPAEKTYDPAKRVPPHFAQVGLTSEQRDKIYSIRAKRLEKINSLKKQLEGLQSEMMTECESVLTDAQRKLLDQRRTSAKDPSKSDQDSAKRASASTKTS